MKYNLATFKYKQFVIIFSGRRTPIHLLFLHNINTRKKSGFNNRLDFGADYETRSICDKLAGIYGGFAPLDIFTFGKLQYLLLCYGSYCS